MRRDEVARENAEKAIAELADCVVEERRKYGGAMADAVELEQLLLGVLATDWPPGYVFTDAQAKAAAKFPDSTLEAVDVSPTLIYKAREWRTG